MLHASCPYRVKFPPSHVVASYTSNPLIFHFLPIFYFLIFNFSFFFLLCPSFYLMSFSSPPSLLLTFMTILSLELSWLLKICSWLCLCISYCLFINIHICELVFDNPQTYGVYCKGFLWISWSSKWCYWLIHEVWLFEPKINLSKINLEKSTWKHKE